MRALYNFIFKMIETCVDVKGLDLVMVFNYGFLYYFELVSYNIIDRYIDTYIIVLFKVIETKYNGAVFNCRENNVSRKLW